MSLTLIINFLLQINHNLQQPKISDLLQMIVSSEYGILKT